MSAKLRIFATSPDGQSVDVRYTPSEIEDVAALEEVATIDLLIETKYETLSAALASGEALQEGAKVR